MTDSFSSAYDSKRNFFRRHWPWFVGALALTLAIAFLCRDWLAMYLGYEKTDLSPGTRFFRNFLIAFASFTSFIIVTGLAFWRNFVLDRQSNTASEQARNDSNRVAGEQFSGAVKLLAQKDAENKPAIDARIGGIYSLQTLANNRIKEYGVQVVKMLIAYIKQNAQLTAQPPLKENETPKEARTLGEDVKTAFNVLKQLLAAREKDSAEWNKPLDGIKLSDRDLNFSGQDFSRLDLSTSQVSGLHRYIWGRVNLQGSNLFCAQLQGAKLWLAQLQDANLAGAYLQNAKLLDAKLQGTDLSEAQLQDASLFSAKLQGAKLVRADLQGANLTIAQLQGANLAEADLQGAKLARADLQGANLADAQMQGADLEKAQLQGANLAGAELQYADLSDAKLDDAILPSNLSGKIWHFGQSELSEIVSLSPDTEWDLTPFLRSGYALVGVLRNFSGRQQLEGIRGERMTRAKKLRMAVRMLGEETLPGDFPQDWRDWLSEIKSDGSHPDDSKRLG